ncbi:MAG TPA: cytochrome P450 [Solirubrobacteraceae bacterium]|jgi:hypothetical protein|nr:cytochrome P450 [Solirubrobacteraceae bacterium]
MPTSLPPGPTGPRLLQTIAITRRQRPWLERNRRRYGRLFTVNVLGLGQFVVVSDPVLVREVFTADPKVLHAGSGSPLGAVLGPNSLLAIDEERHMEQRKLLLPPFHGQRMKGYETLIAAIAAEEIDGWPVGEEIATLPSFMRITLRAILQAVFGAHGAELEELERLIPPYVEMGSKVVGATFIQRDLGRHSPWGRFLRIRAELDRRLDELIDGARRDRELAERIDILSLLLQARHTDGSPMSGEEIRDQLLTLLAAGHETTAGTLAWAVERLRRHPQVTAALVDEIDRGGQDLRDSTIREIQRMRPVISFAGRSVMGPSYPLAGYELPRHTRIGLAASLTHFDPELFPRPDQFQADRFLNVKPETYSWIPFGGGIRRCIGAAFAHMEMDVVLRTLLERVDLLGEELPDERVRFRGVAHVPAQGGRVRVRARRVPAGAPARELVAA